MITITQVKALENYRLWVKFSDGVEGIVDLSEYAGKGVFILWNDYRAFKNVRIGDGGELTWNDQVDMDGIAVYLKITGKKPEDIFPALRAIVHA